MLAKILESVIAFASAHHDAAYGLILLVSLLEALPVIGAVVPGDAVILGVSALVPTGALGLWPLIVASFAGAVLGDGLSFWLGSHYRQSIVNRWPLKRNPALIARGETFLRSHGGKSVFVARFTPGVRAVVPVLAGILQMGVVRFLLLNVLSALVWAPAHILAGAAIGASFVLLGAVAGRLALLVALLLVLLGLLIWGARAAVRRLPAQAARAQERLWLWARRRDVWYSRPLLSILDPQRRELPGLVLLGALLVASLWLFFGVLQDVLAGTALVRTNEAVFHFMQSLRTHWVDQIMVAISELGDATVVTATACAAVLWFAWRRNWRAAAHAVAAVVAASLFTVVFNVALHIPQPGTLPKGWDIFSFPSGHSVASAALYGFLAIVSVWEIGARWRLLVTSAAAVLIGTIAFSRVYLGAHWLSDVLAGMAFGLAWASLLAIGYLRHNPPPVGAAGLWTTAGLTFIVVGAVHVTHRHSTDMARYTVQVRQHVVPWRAWWRHGWTELPVRRIDLAGGVKEPLTFQWAGGLKSLRAELVSKGWTRPVPWTLRSSVDWLDPHAPIAALPVLPHLQNGDPAVLVMVHLLGRPAARERLVLRLWPSDLRLSGLAPAKMPVFIGTVAEERARPLGPIGTITEELPHFDGPRDTLGKALAASVHRLAERSLPRPQRGWDGRVLLARSTG